MRLQKSYHWLIFPVFLVRSSMDNVCRED